MRTLFKPILSCAFTLMLLGACSAGGGSDELTPSGGGGSGAGAGAAGSGGLQVDGGGGFDPDAACGYATIPTQREPGTIVIVYDGSSSMEECSDCMSSDCYGVHCENGPSKWEQVETAMTQVLNGLPDDIRMGMLLYPDTHGGQCEMPQGLQVGVDELGKTRASILGLLSAEPPGGDTPTEPVLEMAYAALQSVQGSGRKGVLLVTDGAWNVCSDDAAIYANAEQRWNQDHVSTIVVGIPGSATGWLSHLAHVGGADRMQGCNGELPDPLHPLKDPSCANSPSTCCHYVVGKNVETDLVQALNDIASKFLTSCVFEVPKGTDPSKFDPNFVNVYVDGDVVYRGADGWDYVAGGSDSLEIFGALCDQLLKGEKQQVEIVLGCATQVK